MTPAQEAKYKSRELAQLVSKLYNTEDRRTANAGKLSIQLAELIAAIAADEKKS